MIPADLTMGIRAAKSGTMQKDTWWMPVTDRRVLRAATMGMVALAMAGGTTGCVSVKAPDKPIVIELNINIKQEVVYKLDKGVQNLIDKNAEIF